MPANGRRAASRCVGSAAREDGRNAIEIAVEDDGLPESARTEMLKRGRRLDETKLGSGLGLSIVVDLAGLYQGTLAGSGRPAACAVLNLPGDGG